MGLVVGEGGGLVEFFKTVELDLASIEFWREEEQTFLRNLFARNLDAKDSK